MQSRIRAALHADDAVRRLRDFLFAALFYRLPAAWRAAAFAGAQHECPVCGSHLRRFLVLHRDYHCWCPVCRSLQRHRLVWLLLARQMAERGALRGRLLHIAPEGALSDKFARMADLAYIRADVAGDQVDVRLDICDLPLADGSIDLLLCSHVLEHVHDDRRALQEFRRVLTAQGMGLILVPILAETTFEDPTITDPVARERIFGQLDHVRAYGPDVAERIRAAGFTVEPVTAVNLVDVGQIERMGLPAEEVIYLIG